MSDREKEEQALKKLREILAREELHIFTQEEVFVLRNVIKVYRGLLALGWVGTFARNVLLIIVSIVTGYLALTGAIQDWIKKVIEVG